MKVVALHVLCSSWLHEAPARTAPQPPSVLCTSTPQWDFKVLHMPDAGLHASYKIYVHLIGNGVRAGGLHCTACGRVGTCSTTWCSAQARPLFPSQRSGMQWVRRQMRCCS